MFKHIRREFHLQTARTQRTHFLHDHSLHIMKAAYLFAASLLMMSSLALTGCYTQLAGTSGGGGYYGYSGRVYHAPQPLYSDTVRGGNQTAVVYDTTMHGDTMFIDERPLVAPSAADSNTSGGSGEVVNNYYGGTPYYGGFSLGFGWPYNDPWYSPWYPYSYGYGYPGFYPPYYDAFWGAGYYPYYGLGFYGGFYGGYGRGFYGGYGHGYYGGYGYGRGYGYTGIGRGLNGGLGGEYRSGGIASGLGGGIGTRASSIATRGSSYGQANGGAFRSGQAGSYSADRDAPVHATAPEASGNARAMGTSGASGMASASHQVVVRTSNGQSISSSSANVGGRNMTVVRRSGSNGSRGYSSGRSYGSSGRGGYRSYGGGRGYGGGYSSGRSYSGGGGGRSGGGGGGSRSGGGGGGHAR